MPLTQLQTSKFDPAAVPLTSYTIGPSAGYGSSRPAYGSAGGFGGGFGKPMSTFFFFEREHELTRSQQNAAPTAAAMRPARNSPSPPSLRILPTWATSPSMRLKATSKTFSSIVTSRVCALLRISWIASPRGLDTLSLVLWKA